MELVPDDNINFKTFKSTDNLCGTRWKDLIYSDPMSPRKH